MSIADQLSKIQSNLAASKAAVVAKGGTVTEGFNTLAAEIAAIPSGGSSGSLDPETVYANTRPAHWLKMPTPEEGEYYFLIDVTDVTTPQTLGAKFTNSNSSATAVFQWGTSDNGTFVPTATENATGTTLTASHTFQPSDFYDGGESKQIIMKVKITGASKVVINRTDGDFNRYTLGRTVEIACKDSMCYTFTMGSTTSDEAKKLKYFAMYGSHSITNFTSMFQGCNALIAILSLDVSKATLFPYMFQNCQSLISIPEWTATSGTAFNNMFAGCYSLTYVPQLSMPKGTNFSRMFSDCYSLRAIPQMVTTVGRDFSYMFSGCRSLDGGCQMTTTNGTTFAYMFQNCYSLTAAPKLNTANGTDFSYMFNSCPSLTKADLSGYNFSKATANGNYVGMFSGGAAGLTIFLPTQWGSTPNVSMVTQNPISADYPVKVVIQQTSKWQIGSNATNIFPAAYEYVYVYVPDNLLEAYQTDTYWATLGSRLKPMSEL